MVNLHKGDGYAGDAFSVRNGPGIRYVQFLVDDAQKAAQSRVDEFGGRITEDDGLTCVSAGLGPVHLIFESAEPDAVADEKQDGVHLCVYVDAFSEHMNGSRRPLKDVHEPAVQAPGQKSTRSRGRPAPRTFRFSAFPRSVRRARDARAVAPRFAGGLKEPSTACALSRRWRFASGL